MISKPVKHQILTLGEQISKFTFPEEFTDVINRAYDNDKKSLPGWNQELVGKIQSEHNVNQIINDQLKKIFMIQLLLHLLQTEDFWFKIMVLVPLEIMTTTKDQIYGDTL